MPTTTKYQLITLSNVYALNTGEDFIPEAELVLPSIITEILLGRSFSGCSNLLLLLVLMANSEAAVF